MAGRILPVALAAIVGVSIGVATFDGEFKKQRLARMEEEYQRYANLLAHSDSLQLTYSVENWLLLLLRKVSALPLPRLANFQSKGKRLLLLRRLPTPGRTCWVYGLGKKIQPGKQRLRIKAVKK